VRLLDSATKLQSLGPINNLALLLVGIFLLPGLMKPKQNLKQF
jgi:hypothetical protein